jgi:hypothetical protein
MSKPIRIKLYGFLWVTKGGYYLLMLVSVVLLLGLLIAWLVLPFPAKVPERAGPGTVMFFWVWKLLPWIELAILLLGWIEPYLVLRRFAQEEKVQRALSEPLPKS